MNLITRPSETLGLLDQFLPRITLGRTVPPAVGATGARAPGGVAQPDAHSPGPEGFTYLKRDLVRLLGILASGRRAVQDRVRACGGIPIVLSLCVIDDRNPCGYHRFTLLWLERAGRACGPHGDSVRPASWCLIDYFRCRSGA